MSMYANVVLRDEQGEDLQEDAIENNPIYPPIGAEVRINKRKYLVEAIEFDYDVSKGQAFARIAIIVYVNSLGRRR